MAGSCPNSLHGFECSLVYIVGALIVLGAILIRKNVANDLLAMPFSIIGGSAGGLLPYMIIIFMFGSLKWALLIGIIGMIAGGFLLGNTLGDGEA
jgi:hypothetical protein